MTERRADATRWRSRDPGEAAESAGQAEIARRYVLQDKVTTGAHSSLWRGRDTVLDRPVAVRLLEHGNADQVQSLLLAAGRAGQVSSPSISMTYDAAADGPGAFVIGAWTPGLALSAVISDGPLPALRTAHIGQALARALVAAHARQCAHGRLHPGNVVLGSQGQVTVTDLAVGQALAGRLPAPTLSPAAPVGAPSPELLDVRCLGGVLYACITGCWPASRGVAGLPPAPRVEGRFCAPREVRAGVSRRLEEAVLRLLGAGSDPDVQTATEALRILSALPSASLSPMTADKDATAVGATRAPGPRAGRGWLVGLMLLLVTVILGAGAGLLLTLPSGGGGASPPGITFTSPAAPPQVAPPVVTPLSVRAFDPPPGDNQENSDTAALAVDGRPTTSWRTERYLDNPAFGRTKPGVGLVLDLGRPVDVSSVEVVLPTAGQRMSLWASDAAPPALAGWTELSADSRLGERGTLGPVTAGPHRFLLLWITELPPDGAGAYRGGVSEIRVLG